MFNLNLLGICLKFVGSNCYLGDVPWICFLHLVAVMCGRKFAGPHKDCLGEVETKLGVDFEDPTRRQSVGRYGARG